MNGAHDLGGMQNLGRVEREQDEPVFHSDWERRAFAMHVACGGQALYNLDEFRYGIELMDPVHYLASRYYEHWLETVERNLIRSGTIDRERLDELTSAFEAAPDAEVQGGDDPELTARLMRVVADGDWTDEPTDRQPALAVGDRVVTRNITPLGHTRLPRYARAKTGVVRRIYPSLVLPDSNAHGRGTNPQHVYNVEFSALELFGESPESDYTVLLDLWESYLQPAGASANAQHDEVITNE